MHPGYRIFTKTLFMAFTAVGLAACGSVSKNIASDGSSAGTLVWPAPDSTTPMHKGGTSPTLTSLRHIHAGMEKKQIAELIGYPHFSEGMAWSVREWNYLFHLRQGDDVTRCQYKILFDKDKLAQSFYWEPAACADLLEVPASEAAVADASFTLSADALFAFDSANLGGTGRERLDDMAHKIIERQGDINSIRIVGYTDKLGSKSYNGLLSAQRAHAVMRYLQASGVPGGLMTATGLGKAQPVTTDCEDRTGHDARVACLAPNRRVEVRVFGKQ